MKLQNKLTIFTIVVFASLTLQLPAQVPNKSHKKKQSFNQALLLDPAVRTGKLPNGFTYYIRHNEEPKNRVVMYMVNKAGSILEDEDQRGLAHFMEHMSFNGTTHFPHNELVDYLQKAGVRFGADINAYTSFDETVYELPLPSDKPAILHQGIAIMHDWAQSATLDPVEIDKERGVVLEEKRLGKGADERMRRLYWPVLLNNSRYAVRVPIGLDTVLDNFKRPTIARFYHDWYRPDLQALIIVGDIDADSMVNVVKTKFADLKNPPHEKVRPDYIVPLTGKSQFIAVTDREMTQTEAEIIIKHKELALKTTADYRKFIIQNLFNRMLTERYAELSRQADPPFVEGSASIGDFIGGLNIFDVGVIAKPGELEKGFKAVWRESERVKRFGFTISELKRAKVAYLNALDNRLREKDKTNSESFVKEYQVHFLKGIAAPGIVGEVKLTRDDLPNVTLDEINKFATDYIVATGRDILIEAPEKDKSTIPNNLIVNSWLKAVQGEQLLPYKDAVSEQSLFSQFPVAGKVVAEMKNTAVGLTILTLSNGLRVILKPTSFKNNEIQLSAFAPGGTSLCSDTDFQSAANAATIIASCGVGNYNATQLRKYLEGKEVNISPYIDERYQGFNGTLAPKDLETALQMIYAYFTEPRKDSAVFNNIIEKSKAELANRHNDPNNVFIDTVSALLGNYNIRRTGPTMEKLSQINLDKAYAFYKQRFADASTFVFTFVGSIDTTVIKPLLEKYLGALPAINSHDTTRDLGIHIPEGEITKNIYKGTEPKSTVLLIYSGSFDYNPQNKVKLDALKEVLEIRLLQRLREEESGVYSPGVYAENSKFPQHHYSFMIQFGCAPQNVDKLITSTLDEINKLRTDGPLQENLDKWRAEAKASAETTFKTNDYWTWYLNQQMQDQADLAQVTTYTKRLDEVTTASIKDVALKYLSGDNFIRLVLLPENDNSRQSK